MNGKIKKLNRDRGYGFIEAEEGKEIFFHQSALVDVEYDSLQEGQHVQFDVEDDPKGPRAGNMKLSADQE